MYLKARNGDAVESQAVMALPAKYRRRMKSTNMQERLIREIRRRERVIGIFPNVESAQRLIGANLARDPRGVARTSAISI